MKCIVTGGEGFIGSHIVEHLLSENNDVIVIDDESAPQNINFFKFDGASYYNISVCEESSHELYEGVDYVFHTAARSRIQPTIGSPRECFDVNVLGTQSVLEACKKHGVRKVIYSGSSSYYGVNSKIPFSTDENPDCLNPYSLSKYMGEKLCTLYSDLYDVSTIILRYFNVYGPREPLKGPYAPVIGLFKRQKEAGKPMTVVGDGNQRRDFTHVSDVVSANIMSAMSDIYHDTFNVGTGKNYSINDIVELVGGEHINIPQRKAESSRTLACINKTTDSIGWYPKINLDDVINTY